MASYTSYIPTSTVARAMFNFDAGGVANFKLVGTVNISVSDSFTYLQYLAAYPALSFEIYTSLGSGNANWTSFQLENVDLVANTFSNFVNLNFSAVTNLSGSTPANAASASDINISLIYRTDLAFSGMSALATDANFGYAGSRGDVVLNVDGFGPFGLSNDYSLSSVSYGFHVLMHEIGHSLGLSHPHAIVNGVRTQTADYSLTTTLGFDKLGFRVDSAADMDKAFFSIMSYDDRTPAGEAFAQTPMILDVLALQSAYGEGRGTSGFGNDVIAPGGGGAVGSFRTYFDTGGADTIDLTNYSSGAYLHMGTTIVGAAHLVGVSMSIADANTMLNLGGDPSSLRWFYGEYENATGSATGDVIIGNGLGNTISGQGGDDYIDGEGGGDFLNGGSGNDTFVFGLGYGQAFIQDFDAAPGNVDTVSFLAGITPSGVHASRNGTDVSITFDLAQDRLTISQFEVTSYRIERFEFADSTVWDYAALGQIINSAPVVSAPNSTLRPNQSTPASSLFSVSDAEGDAITLYRFWDGGIGGGYFAVNGVQQPAQQSVEINAVNLASVSYVAGPAAGTETEWVQVFDGTEWSAWQSWTMSTVNHAPVVTVANATLRPNQSTLASGLLSATDADGDPITLYRFWDGGIGGGYFTVNGSQQPAQRGIDVSAANLSAVRYVAGAAAGAETEWVQVFDGADWSEWKSWTMTTVNHAPVAGATNQSVHKNQAVVASTLFSAADADGDAITQYQFYDGGAGGGYFTLNGIPQAAQQAIGVSAAGLANVRYVGGAALGAETQWVRAFDGIEWGAWTSWTMSTVNQAPVASAADAALAHSQSVAASTLFSVSDADGDAIAQYRFWDSGAGGGYFSVNGVQQAAQQGIDVSAANLASMSYVAGLAAGAETVWVQAFDGTDWSAWVSWTMTTQGSAPVISAANRGVHVNQAVAASTLFSVSDADGSAIAQYQFWDGGADGGYFTINGVAQAANQAITVAAANLAQVSYVGGSASGAETVWARASDASGYGAWKSWTMNTGNNAPVASAANAAVTHGRAVVASTLFSVTDADGDAITQYQFYDGGAGGGYFTLNGIPQAAQQAIDVSAAGLANVRYVGGAALGAETQWVRAFDGIEWGAWTSWTMSTVNQAPVTSASNAALMHGQAVAASALFNVSDGDGDAITQYRFYDAGVGGGYFTVNGMEQAAQQGIDVSAANLTSVGYVAGLAAGAETVWVHAFDGAEWGAWASWIMTTQDSAPVISAANRGVHVNQAVAASTLFSVSDADGSAIAQYQLWDGGTGGGYFTVNGVTQAANQAITVAAANLAQVSYVGGSASSAETVWARASDASGYGAWKGWTMNTGNNAPVTSAAAATISLGQWIDVSSLFSAADADGDAITQYRLYDGSAGGGYFTLNGVPQAAHQGIAVSAAELVNVRYVAGAPGAETHWVQAFDGIEWGAWATWNISTALRFPEIAGTLYEDTFHGLTDTIYFGQQAGDVFHVSNQEPIFMGGSGGDSYVIGPNSYAIIYENGNSAGDTLTATGVGAEVIDGQRVIRAALVGGRHLALIDPIFNQNVLIVDWQQAANRIETFYFHPELGAYSYEQLVNLLPPAQLPNITWEEAGYDTAAINEALGYYAQRAARAEINVAPAVAPINSAVRVGRSLSASSLFTVADANGDAITSYEFVDTSAGAGHFVMNGVQQNANWDIVVPAGSIGQLSYVAADIVAGATTSETVKVRAFDGMAWSEWAYLRVTTVGNQIPTVDPFDPTQLNVFAPAGLSTLASTWFRVRDLDGDPITQYQFRNYSTLGAPTGQFVLNGIAQAAGPDQWFTVNANQLDSLVFVGGDPAQPFENITVRVSDGQAWSTDLSLFARFPQILNRPPSIVRQRYDVTVASGQSSAVAGWFTVSDPDGDAVTLRFVDQPSFENPDRSGYFTVSGVRQNPTFTIDSSQLGSVQFVAAQVVAAQSVVDSVLITASSGAFDGAPVSFGVYSTAHTPPVVNASDAAVGLNQSIPVSSFFTTANPPQNPFSIDYVFIDFGDDPAGGYFTLDGLRLNSNQALAGHPDFVRYVGGSQAGTEMISIQAWNSEPVRISIRTGDPVADGAGNDLAGARNMTLGMTPSTFTDMVGNADAADYYRLDLTSPGNLVIGMTNLGGNADLRLLDSNGAVLANSLGGQNTSESITKTVAAGTYYALVTPVGGDSTSYKFTALIA